MSRLSATFVLNYLTRVVPSLGHVGTKMRADRVVKGAAILVAIGGILSEKPAFAATFTWDNVFPATTSTNVSFATGQNFPVINAGVNTGVRVQFDFGTRGGVTLHDNAGPPNLVTNLFVGKLGGPSSGVGDPNITLAAFIRNPNVVSGATGIQDWGNLTFRTRFTNAAGQNVPVNNLSYQIVDIDKDDNAPANTQPLRWQDQVTTFALLDTTGVPINVTADAPGSLGTVPLTTPAVITTGNPAPNVASVNVTPATARTFQGGDDLDTTNSGPASTNDLGTNNTGPETDGNALTEASNRSREGNLLVDTGASSATEFVVMYGDGNAVLNPTPPVAERQHGAGVLGKIDFNPGIIGVRKEVKRVVNNGSTVIVEYEVAVTNLGAVRLDNIRLDDNLARPVNTNPSLDPAIGGYFRSFGNIPGAGLAAGTTVKILSGGTLTGGNAAYNGNGDDGLLNGTDSLDPNTTKTISYTVEFTPGAVTKFDTQVVASGTMPGGGITRDRSNDGTAFDGNGDNDPTAAGVVGSDLITADASFTRPILGTAEARGLPLIGAGSGSGDDTVTSFILQPPVPQIGVTKKVLSSQPVPGQTGVYDVTYLQVVRNVSAASATDPLRSLTAVQLTENFAGPNGTFRINETNGAGSAVVLIDPASAIKSLTQAEATAQGFTNPGLRVLAVNPGFTGNGANELLISTNNQLDRGEFAVIRYTVRVSPRAGGPALENPIVGVFDGQVTATANRTGGTAEDLSDDVTDVATVAADDAATAADYQSQVPRLGFAANTPAGSQPRPSVDGPVAAATNRNNKTPVSFAAQAAKISLGKRVTNVIDNGNGTFSVTYRQIVQNTGTETLNNVRITEDLSRTFRTGNTITGARAIDVTRVDPVTSLGSFTPPAGSAFKALTVNPSFEGVAGQSMLATGNSLAPNEYGAVDFTVLVTPGNTPESYGLDGPGTNDGPFNGQARAEGDVNDGTSPSDLSNDLARFPTGTVGAGVQPGDALTPADSPTPVQFPQIAVAKRVSNIQRTGTGNPGDPFVYQVEYTIVTTNVGAVRLENVQTSEPTLASVFPGVAATYIAGSLQPVPLAELPLGNVAPPALNSAAAGLFTSTQNLFAGALALDPGQSTTVRYRVSVSNPTDGVTFTSQSTATGDGDPAPTVPTGTLAEGGIPVLKPSDKSDDGPFVDQTTTDGLRGRGPSEDDPTPVIFPAGPRIGLTKQVFGTPLNRGDGTYDVTFRYEVRNTGGVPLNNVTIADSLRNQFQGNGRGSLINPRPAPVTEYLGVVVAPAFVQGTPVGLGTGAGIGLEDDPNNSANAIATVPTLGLGESSIVQVVVRIRPGDANLNSIYEGAAQTKGDVSEPRPGQPPQVTDISDDGTNINNVPARPASDRIGLFGPEVPGLNDATVETRNPTPVILAQSISPIALYKAITAVPGATFTQPLGLGAPTNVFGVSTLNRNLSNGDQVEYSLYVINSTGIAQTGFEVCDPLRAGQVFVPGSASSTPSGITAQAFSPLAIPGPAPLGRTCNLVPGTDGQSPFAGGTVVFPNFTLQPGLTTLKFNVRIQR
jgi:uncharacterized repeat protein (TIGR01451 family)